MILTYSVQFFSDEKSQIADGNKSAKEANGIFLSLLFEELRAGSHKEVTLSKQRSYNFLQTVHARNRNLQSYPFPFDISYHLMKDGKQVNEKESKDLKQQNIKGSHKEPDGAKTGQDFAGHYATIPQWRCFVKAVNNRDLVLTFIPNTFEDLVLLNCTASDDGIVDESTVEEGKQESAQLNDVTVTSSLAVQNTEVTEESIVDRPNTDAECSQEKDTSSEVLKMRSNNLCDPQQTSLDISQREDQNKPEKETEKIGLRVPVYVYDCIMPILTDSIINPWSFQLPADFYQDMTFEPQPEVDEELSLQSPKGKKVTFSVDSLKVRASYFKDTSKVCFVDFFVNQSVFMRYRSKERKALLTSKMLVMGFFILCHKFLTHYHTIQTFFGLERGAIEHIMGTDENAGTSIFSFSHNVFNTSSTNSIC